MTGAMIGPFPILQGRRRPGRRRFGRSGWLWVVMAAIALIGDAGPALATAAETLPGPVPAEVVRVIDGDTIQVRARIWLGQNVETLVRLAGIDTPELHGGCAESRALAAEARRRLTALVASRRVTLYEVRTDAHGGRVVARVRAEDGTDVAEPLLAGGLARRYDGRGRRPAWCGAAARQN